jgi:hypothetical protein
VSAVSLRARLMVRMHKKGITEEVAKKRSRKNVKIQVGPRRMLLQRSC